MSERYKGYFDRAGNFIRHAHNLYGAASGLYQGYKSARGYTSSKKRPAPTYNDNPAKRRRRNPFKTGYAIQGRGGKIRMGGQYRVKQIRRYVKKKLARKYKQHRWLIQASGNISELNEGKHAVYISNASGLGEVEYANILDRADIETLTTKVQGNMSNNVVTNAAATEVLKMNEGGSNEPLPDFWVRSWKLFMKFKNAGNMPCRLMIYKIMPRVDCDDSTANPETLWQQGIDLNMTGTSGDYTENISRPTHSKSFNAMWKIVGKRSLHFEPMETKHVCVKSAGAVKVNGAVHEYQNGAGIDNYRGRTVRFIFVLEGDVVHDFDDNTRVNMGAATLDYVIEKEYRYTFKFFENTYKYDLDDHRDTFTGVQQARVEAGVDEEKYDN